MSNNLLQKLMAAQTDEERSWIVTENLLESLPEDVARALWAVAIPHWFDAEILAALCPELANRADQIYQQLQNLSCVEVFPERGHNVHELTRNQLLDHLCKKEPELFYTLSGKALAYFANGNKSEHKIEWIYHSVVVSDSYQELDGILGLLYEWVKGFRRSELLSLFNNLQEQLTSIRVPSKSKRNIETLASLVNVLSSQLKPASTKREAKKQARSFIQMWALGAIATGFSGISVSHYAQAMTYGDLIMVFKVGLVYGINLNISSATAVFTAIVSPLLRSQIEKFNFQPFLGIQSGIMSGAITIAAGEALITYFHGYSDLPE